MICPRIPVEDFCRDPAISNVHLSPCGTKVSFLRPWSKRQNIFVLDVATKEAVNGTFETDLDVTTYFWKSDRYLIYQTDAGIYRRDLQSGTTSPLLLADNQAVTPVDLLKWSSDTDVLVELHQSENDLSDVYRINVCSEILTPTRVAEHPDPDKFGPVRKWLVDDCGEVYGAITVKGINDYLHTRTDSTSPFQMVRQMDFRSSIEDQFYPYLFPTADNQGICAIARTHPDRDTAAVVVLSAKTGQEIRSLYHNPEVDVASIGFSRKRKVVTYVAFHNGKLRYKILDPEIAPIFETLKQLPRDYVFRIVDNDIAEKKFIVLACNDTTPGEYYLLDATNSSHHKLIFLGEIAPWLKGKSLAPVRSVEFRARDGLTIHGYLTLPVGGKPKGMIVNVHGGPENRNYWHYDSLYSSEVQFLANRGYAIFQLNFRGSIGYGRSFWTKGFKERGGTMLNDVTDGVRWLIKERIADPNRIVICGKSYGGYAALAGVAFNPELYCAAIDCAGVSNWLTWLQESFPPGDPLYPQFCVKVGDPTEDEKQLSAVAPVLHADKINKPVLIVHGTADQEVDIAESERMVAALRGNNKSVVFKKFPKEGHIFEKPESKVRFCRAMEEFLTTSLA